MVMFNRAVTATEPQGVPESFSYYRNHGRPEFRRVATAMRLLTRGRLELPAEVVAAFGRDRARADALSDDFVEACYADGTVRHVRKWVEAALRDGIDTVTEAPEGMQALFGHLDTEPEWLDWDRIERGARVFRRYGVDAFIYFGLVGIEGYNRESIYKPLVLTGAYTGGTTFNRYLETCRFWTDVSEPDALRQGGDGRRTAVLVRVMHSMIRHRIAPHPEWDTPRLGQPLNQLDQFGTIMLSFALNQHLKLTGYWPSDTDVLDHMHFWRYVGYLLGVEPSFYPETIQDLWRVTYLFYISSDPNDCPDSRRLQQSFIEAFAPKGTETDKRQREKRLEQRHVHEHTAFLLPATTLAAAEIASPGLRRWRPALRFAPNTARELARRAVPGLADRIDDQQRQARTAWLEQHLTGRRAAFTPVDKLTR